MGALYAAEGVLCTAEPVCAETLELAPASKVGPIVTASGAATQEGCLLEAV